MAFLTLSMNVLKIPPRSIKPDSALTFLERHTNIKGELSIPLPWHWWSGTMVAAAGSQIRAAKKRGRASLGFVSSQVSEKFWVVHLCPAGRLWYGGILPLSFNSRFSKNGSVFFSLFCCFYFLRLSFDFKFQLKVHHLICHNTSRLG